jgi:hypothetical protein
VKISNTDREIIFKEVKFVSTYAEECDDWVTVKKEVMKSLPPKLRKNFSTRDPKTKEQSLNKFEESIIIYYKEITGIGLVLRSLAERRDRFNGF